MNKGTIFAIGAALGGIVGSELTFAWTKKKYDEIRRQDYEHIRNEFEEKRAAIDKIKAMGYSGEESGSQNASVTHQEPHRAILGNENNEEVGSDKKKSERANKRSKEYTDYSHISKQNSKLIAPIADKTVAQAESEHPKDDDLMPYIITPNQFDSGDNEKVEMHYYMDGTLTDDMDEPIDQNEYFPNIDIEGSFDDESDEPDLLFIRDPKLKIDYEISKILVRYPETTGEWN